MNATFLKSVTKIEDLPQGAKPHVVLVGRSNVGKSSLLNHLVNHKGLARVSNTPGRTQTINLFDVDKKMFLVDLPGYGYAKASKDKREAFEGLINDYLCDAKNIKLILVIIDARHGTMEIDREMLTYLEQGQIPYAIIANKIDKLSRTETAALIKKLDDEYPGTKVILHSNVTDKGHGEIKELMERL